MSIPAVALTVWISISPSALRGERGAAAADRVQTVNLRGEFAVAREIAVLVRETGGGFPGVRALGLDLPRAGIV